MPLAETKRHLVDVLNMTLLSIGLKTILDKMYIVSAMSKFRGAIKGGDRKKVNGNLHDQ